uniref:Odorant receptor 22b n=1 Tax=Sirex nitobei TaxID=1602346 RepID=A0A857N579_9HYME|nr:odorant receptor 22b [Sirex nitobei]
MMLLVQMLACSLQFCFQGYQIISILRKEHGQLSFPQLAFLISLLVAMGSQLFVYCYVGQNLITESTKLSYAAYQCDWYKLTVQDARDLLLVILRARTPLEITAGKFCSFSFSLFCDIVKNSVGYLSVLLAVNEQSNN